MSELQLSTHCPNRIEKIQSDWISPVIKKQILTRLPWHFRLAKWMMRNDVRGGYRLERIAERFGWLNFIARLSVTEKLTLDVPFYRKTTRWDLEDVLNYDEPTVRGLANAIDRMPEPVIFIDCGADIGVMSIRVASKTKNIRRFIAIEPNQIAHTVLVENYKRLPVQAEVRFGAVGRTSGRGNLNSPDYLPDDDHAKFISFSAAGQIPIFRIDDLDIEPNQCIVLKLDVEGGELDAVEGAAETLSRCSHFVVDIEAHPKVAERTGTDPIVILRRLNEIRACDFQICEHPDFKLSLEVPFFNQVDGKNFDIIAVSK